MNTNSMILIVALLVTVLGIIVGKNYFLSSPDASMDTSTTTMTGGLYTEYDESLLPSLSGDIVLFFHADWCPTCRQADNNFLTSGIPAGLNILKVDFDTATDLRKKYTVLTQTSFVQISSTGEMINRWVGGLTIEDVMSNIKSATSQTESATTKTGSDQIAKAYFAGGCFWCMEGPFEVQDGVKSVYNGYIGGDARNANYDKVSLGATKHREAVEVIYDPALVTYEELLTIYRRQIDPTDDGGQFADRGYQYTTAIYYSSPEEEQLALQSKAQLESSNKFDTPIVVQILPATPFYQAEDYHQDYYKNNSMNYKRYKKGSGREGFIETNRKDEIPVSTEMTTSGAIFRKDRKPKTSEDLTPAQRKILFEGGTEPPFNNAYRDNHEAGIYVDVIDGTPLFSSTDKFDSGTGWPSFSRPIADSFVGSKSDTSHGMDRTEVKSANSNGHLGHIFDDGPTELGGTRYCINSAALEFVPVAELDAKGYSEYKKLFQ